MKVSYFQRKPRRDANYSIELVFETLRGALADRVDASLSIAPFLSNGLFRRLAIAAHAARRQGELNHVTGDINFVVLALDPRATILTHHDCDLVDRHRGLRGWLLRRLWLDWPVRRAALVTAVSERTRDDIIAYTRCAPEKVVVIPNPVPPGYRPFPKRFDAERPRILHVGTKPNKNLSRVAEALAGVSCTLAVVGGRLSSEQERLLRARRIAFQNYVDLSPQAVVRQYELADIVSFPSLSEGFGLPILEAQAVGRAVVTSRRAPMSEVAGRDACLVDPTDVRALRSAFLRIAADGDHRRRLVQAGFENVKRFAAERIAEQYLRVYEHVRANAR